MKNKSNGVRNLFNPFSKGACCRALIGVEDKDISETPANRVLSMMILKHIDEHSIKKSMQYNFHFTSINFLL
ncbi:hypothetical protein GCM10007877_08290 [Marinibactrum halimedae]|uniref:Uncharacterized protein n=1 Tax=Marinibactrum halimedae TaxID=1444977 RepID=A0AA37WLC6_9GAMM|nr:hypothetical protein GCM10007877_08290 [Marinibactrum halimedae]